MKILPITNEALCIVTTDVDSSAFPTLKQEVPLAGLIGYYNTSFSLESRINL